MIIVSDSFVKTPLVSVRILTYNHEKYIAQTIESVLAQKCNFDIEIIIGEDAGSDFTREICIQYQQKYPEKIKLVLQDNNKGVMLNYRDVTSLCRGKYVAGCGGDDYWHNPNKLQLQVDYMESHPQCGVVHTDYDQLSSHTGKITLSYWALLKVHIPTGYIQQQVFKGELKICASTALVRKELYDKYIPLDKYIELKFPIEDWPTWVILSKYSEINYLPNSTATYRRGHESLTNLPTYDRLKQKYLQEKIMYKYICDLFPEDLPFDDYGYDSYLISLLLNLAYRKCDYESAKKYAKELMNRDYKNLKVKLTRNRLLFYTYCLLKKGKR